MSTPPDPSSPVERRLATILVADVFGYSRMMGEDEERTVRTLRGHRAVFDDLLKTYRGRVFNTAGDAILAEFPSAVDAVRCATEIQSALRTRNEQLPETHRMWFRIGINLGDVIVQDGDLLGDGVNIAARIEAATEPGGVCISGSVYDQIQNKLSLTFRQLPEQSFKNIAQ
ncbi:MAG: adenylate/guanylate cyclase domain-containing protein, partial [Burkholderiales bacterium]|nr:adenylate/guanylate cyclase domain-containing protein [Burkholderiales bacterium]